MGKTKKGRKDSLICPECGSTNVTWHGEKNESYNKCLDCTHKFGRESWGKERKGKNWYAD